MYRPVQFDIRDEPLSPLALTGLGLMLALASAVFISFPLYALLAVSGLLGLAIGINQPQWVLFVFGATLMLGEMPIGPSTSISSATALIFLIVAAGSFLLARAPIYTRSAVPTLLILWLICLAVSAAMKPEWTSEHGRSALTLVMLAVTAMAVILVLRRGEWIWQLATVLALSSALVSLITIYEAVTGQFNPVGIFEGASDDRAYGLSDPNYTAALLVTFIPFLVMYTLAGKSRFWRATALCLTGLTLAAIASTASRGGVVGVLVVVVAMSFLAAAPNSDSTRRTTSIKRRISIVVPLLVCGIIAAGIAPQVFWDRAGTLQDWSHPRDVKDSRVDLWEDYIPVWLKSPIWGNGPGMLDPAVIGNTTQFPHNTILQLAIEIGLVGLLPYLAVNGWAFWEALRARKLFAQQGNERLSVVSGAVALSLIGFHSTAFFLTSATHKELWVLIGMSGALHHIATSPKHSTRIL